MATPPGTITNVMFFDPHNGGYYSTPPALSLGQGTGVAATGNNASAYPTNMQMVFIITKPDGTQVTLTSPITAVAPGSNFAGLAPVTVDQEGNWTVEVRVMGEYNGTQAGSFGIWTYYYNGWQTFSSGAVLPVTSMWLDVYCVNNSNVPRTAQVVLFVTPPGGTASQLTSSSVDLNPGAGDYFSFWITVTSGGFLFAAGLYLDGTLCAINDRTAG